MSSVPITGILTTKNYKHFAIRDSAYNVLAEFDGAKLANPALHGDLVTLEGPGAHLKVERRAEHPMLAGLLHMKSNTIYGMTSHGVPIYLFYPFDRRYPPFRVGSKAPRDQNRLALIRVADFGPADTFPRGNLERILGVAGDFDAEREALAFTASPFIKKISPKAHTTVADHREHICDSYITVNIDPEGCKDIDDVVSLKALSDGSWNCIISIADVDDAVPAGSEMDLYAQKTLQTVYNMGRAERPMLPEVLSEGICSLIPGSPRPVIGLKFRYVPKNEEGRRIVDCSFNKYYLTNQKSYTYEDIVGTTDFPVTALKDIVTEIAGGPTNCSHEWVARLMMFYNLKAAEILGSEGIYRAHDGPNSERLAELLTFMSDADAQMLANSAAKYVTGGGAAKTHYGFGGRQYAHTTSPIRRYADLYNQRLIKAHIVGLASEGGCNQELVYKLNEVSRAARDFDRCMKFMSALEAKEPAEAIVIGQKADKVKIYVVPWKMSFNMNKVDQEFTLGSKIIVNYHYDSSKVSWKERMIFQVVI